MTDPVTAEGVTLRKSRQGKPTMSFGKKFEEFKKRMAKKKSISRGEENLIIDRTHIVNAVGQYLVANSLWDDGKEITNIQFSDLFGASTVEYCKMRIFYEKGGVK